MDLDDIFTAAKNGRFNEKEATEIVKKTPTETVKAVHESVKKFLEENMNSPKRNFQVTIKVGELNFLLGKYSGIKSNVTTAGRESNLIPEYGGGLTDDDLSGYGHLIDDGDWGEKAVTKYMSELMAPTRSGAHSGQETIDVRDETLEERSARSTNSAKILLDRTNNGRIQGLEKQIDNMTKMLNLECNEKTRNRINSNIEELKQEISRIRTDAIAVEKSMLRMEAQYVERELEEQSQIAKEMADIDRTDGQLVLYDKNGKQLSASAINSQIDSAKLWQARFEQDSGYRALDHLDGSSKNGGPTVNVSVNVKTKDSKAGRVRVVETFDKFAENSSINDDNEIVDGAGNVIARLVTLANGKKSFVKV